MFKVKKKNLIYYAACFLFILSVSLSVPATKSVFLNILRDPLILLRLAKREAAGIIFYHRNFIQNEKLKKENDLLKYRLNSQEEAFLENRRLKGLLSIKEQAPYKVISARVIARSPDSWSNSIIIDKGTLGGIKRGMGVVTYYGLAGRVTEVLEFTSCVLLVNDPNFNVSGIVQRSRQEGLVSGTLQGGLIMRYLPEGADIQPEDVIVTSGFNKANPKGILIGSVVEIGRDFSGLSLYAKVKPAVNLSNIEEVLVIVP